MYRDTRRRQAGEQRDRHTRGNNLSTRFVGSCLFLAVVGPSPFKLAPSGQPGPNSLLQPMPPAGNPNGVIRDVWSDNLDTELDIIRALVEDYPYVAMVPPPLCPHFYPDATRPSLSPGLHATLWLGEPSSQNPPPLR